MMELDWEALPYLESVIGFTLIISALHFYLDTRQLRALRLPKPPKSVAHLYKGDDFKTKQAYQQERLKFSMVHSAWETLTTIGFLQYGYYPVTWAASGNILSTISSKVSFINTGEINQSIVWVLLLGLASTVLSLPWSYYKTFVLEEKHGFNKTTLKTFITDIFKSALLSFILAPPIVGAVTWILIHTGANMALYLWGFLFGLSLVMMTIYPLLIDPLFNKYTALEEGSLRTKIEELAARVKFPLKKLYKVDGSTRSAHSNAYLYGFGNNRRIVLYDTLIDQCTEEQVVSVLAHELGHFKLHHTKYLFVSTQALLAAQLSLFAMFKSAPGLYESFGFAKDDKPALAALMLFGLVIGPVDEFLNLLQNMVSRMFEFQADAFGVSLGHGKELKNALLVLDKENKGPPNVDKWYSTANYSHPPLPERLDAIDNEMKKSL